MFDVVASAREHGLAFGRVEVGDTLFAYLAAGPVDGPLALCLHGFPDSAWTWRNLLPRLGNAGWRAVAPWMRGYWPTIAPPRATVHPGRLAADAVGLHAGLGGDDRSVVIGHDWGAVAVHGAVGPDSPFRAAVTMAVPHPTLLPRTPWADPRQARMSWYAAMLAVPATAPVLRIGGGALARRLWRQWSPAYEPRTVDLRGWEAAISRDGARTAAGYYRGALPALLSGSWPAATDRPAVPLLHLVGADDGCMHAGQAQTMASLLSAGSRVEVIAKAGHFLHLEQPDLVARLVVDHVGQPGADVGTAGAG